eukprot:CAMPEP_0194034852 /NCGR_PEP_ID=MMETSP0009_2-20130614/7301_1 /TAXON_ID=210454 /ORGANISM="Grammatophora oceanica, Strain CCMP 410" /LENGTH=665 /DNA_ID=CAMNT_0038675955 /DNA_START=363 /DNA_END=2360 /DNA_ORIENTATION=-
MRGGGNGDDISLVVRGQPPPHVFSNESFDVDFGLELAKGRGATDPSADIEFIATLHHFKSGRLAADDATLFCEPQAIVMAASKGSPSHRRKQRIRCSIELHDRRRDKSDVFMVRLSPKEEQLRLSPREELIGTSLHRMIKPIATRAISVVRHKIRVTPESDWEKIWYKDEGGRDKCMSVSVSMYDKNEQLYMGEQVPLQMTLYYANGDEPIKVIKQDILKTLGAAKMYIEKTSGKATLRFRIEDVSKNHQGQDFKVEIAPDARVKGFGDVAPGFTPAVSIRSKRNKRHRTFSSTEAKQEARYQPGSRQAGLYSLPEEAARGRGEAAISTADLPRLRDAIKGVMQWTDEVVNGLYPLQWQVIGYAQNPDGSHDYNRPYHSMPNPNAHITRILSTYSESTRDHLQTILSAVERASPSESYGSLPGTPGTEYTMPTQAATATVDPRMARQAAAFGRGEMPPPPLGAYQGMPPMGTAAAQMNPMQHQQMRAAAAHRHLVAQHPADPYAAHAAAAAAAAAGGLPRHAGLASPVTTTRSGEESRESEVAYVLARHFKALRTDERLGFPAYSKDKEILGFYRESSSKMGVGTFIPISNLREDFGPFEIMQAREILEDAIRSKSEAVHELKDWVSISALLDHALVYDWSRGESMPGVGGSGAVGESPGGGSGD